MRPFLVLLCTILAFLFVCGCSDTSTENISPGTSSIPTQNPYQDEEFRVAMNNSINKILERFDDTADDIESNDMNGLATSGARLSSEAEVQYEIISGYRVSGNWLAVKTNFLRYLDSMRLLGDYYSKSAIAAERGDNSLESTYLDMANSELEIATEYFDLAQEAIPS